MRPRRHARPPGAILLEVMLSIGLFVGAAAFCLGVTKSLFSALERADRRRLAVDLARSKLAELEAGLITVQDLRGEWSGGVGSHPEDIELTAATGPEWEFDAVTTRTEYAGLSLIELTVTEVSREAGVAAEDGVSFTLRQLVALREQDPEAYEADEMLEGLEGVAP